MFGGFTLWPFIESRFSHDRDEHHLLQYPWQAPKRAAIGAGALTLLLVLTIAGGNDVLAVFLQVGLENLTGVLRVLAIVAPIAVGLIVYRLAIERGRQARREESP